MPIIQPQEYAERRRQLGTMVGTEALIIVVSAAEIIRNGDAHYAFRQHSDFYYLTGFDEPNAIAVLLPGRADADYILFNRPRDPQQERWHGNRAGQVGAVRDYGAAASFAIDAFAEMLPQLLQERRHVYYTSHTQSTLAPAVLQRLQAAQTQSRTLDKAPLQLLDLATFVHEMRLYKSAAELATLRRAAAISVEAHRRAMQKCRPGLYEYALEAELRYVFGVRGSQAPAYNSIVAGGAHACTLHYQANNARLSAGELVLIDAACEYENYAADITRTFPIDGRFSPAQRAIYELVLTAQTAVLAAVRPGVPWSELHRVAVQELTRGLVQLGLLQGCVEELIAQQQYRTFYMHNTGHWLGMDVHDVGAYTTASASRVLRPGMVFTVEPGIYIPADLQTVTAEWRGIGVRIEDDVLVTETGYELLTVGLPRTVAEIEALVGTATD